MNNWFKITPAEDNIAVSTRIRLARNLVDFPFPGRMSFEQKKAVVQKVQEAFLNGNSYITEKFVLIDLEKMSQNNRISLVEKHLVSPEFIEDIRGKGLIVSKDQKTAIMINEEDHIRIQVISDSLFQAFDLADKIDTLENEHLNIAYNQRLGYLTQCPTNLGTAMRASVMLHLPALNEIGAMSRIASNLSKLGITVRGTYGEGTEIQGCLYQISNQITLGLSEQEAIENLSSVTQQLILEEKKAEKDMLKNLLVQDRISRALGILKSAKLLTCKEYMGLISLVKLGISTGLILGISGKDLNILTDAIQPATILVEHSLSDTREGDAHRARLVREKLAETNFK